MVQGGDVSMNTAPKPNLSISAQYLGPIFSLNGELTNHAQNLIFARNGTGKSFLSRALHYLDQNGQGLNIDHAAHDLVSDESVDGKGAFSFSRGTDAIGALQLEKYGNNVSAQISDTIFHVFSEDFVNNELRERSYEINGDIENQISVDSESIRLKDTQDALSNAVAGEQTTASALRKKYEQEKITELHDKAGINKQLREYRALVVDELLDRFTDKPASPDQSFTEILKDLDRLKAIPAEPSYPEPLDLIQTDSLDLEALEAALKKVTSPSSVSEDIKKKIDAHHSFYETGTKIVQEGHRSTCPFCEQGITNPGPKAIIDAYIAYFEDEEEKHKSELRDLFRRLNQTETALKDAETRLARQKARYDALKRFMPSRKDTEIDGAEHNSRMGGR